MRRLVGAGLGLTALSTRLVRDDLKRGTLKPVRPPGWPLRRTIRLVRLREAFASKALDRFLHLVRKRVREARFLADVSTG